MQKSDTDPGDLPPLAEAEIETAIEKSPARAADRALVGCLSIVAVLAVPAFFYFGFFAFALADSWNEWGLLDPYLDDETADFLTVIYGPLIELMIYFELY